ncbi:MAG TPA: hypothetical protein VME44_14245 [Streptosporangiaceae bacterium]|nr:hypothetical protein [Streptosporangiaceae bacterium]
MPVPVVDYVIAFVAVAGGVVIGSLQYRRLRGSRAQQVITAPAGWPVRLNAFLVAAGVWTLTNVWAVVAFPAAILVWELAVRLTVLGRRARHGRASRAS